MINFHKIYCNDSDHSDSFTRGSDVLPFYRLLKSSGLRTCSQIFKNFSMFFCSMVFACILLGASTTSSFAANKLKAFACAEGFGASATGGRGGDVYHVTKLSDDGSAGTLRHGLTSARGPRTIVFDIGGNIKLKNWLKIKNDRITIAGQTAPGGGITVSGYPLGITGSSNIIVRYMRFRVGPFNVINPKGGGNGNRGLHGNGADAIFVSGANHVIMDHLSASWALDETVDIQKSENITLQHSIIADSLDDSLHPEGPHSKGILAIGETTKSALARGVGGYTFYRNLLAHHNNRSPLLDGRPPAWMGAEFINNVIYDWGKRPGHNNVSNVQLNYINNYIVVGPSVKVRHLDQAMRKGKRNNGAFTIFYSGNFIDSDLDSKHDGRLVGDSAFDRFKNKERLNSRLPFPLKGDKIASANTAYQSVLQNAGASLIRDSLDRRVIKEVKNRSGRIIDSPSDVGGLISLARGTAPIDSDRDGMPDDWELQNGLDPDNASDRNQTNLSSAGYTNLEVYLDSIVASAGLCDTGPDTVVVPPTPTPPQSGNAISTVQAVISTGKDDAEERKSGQVIVGSKDIDLVKSGSNQTIGLRFKGLNIPNAATIISASIQFTSKTTRSGTTSLTIEGEKSDNAARFNRDNRKNISSRSRTATAVSWSPAAWGRAGNAGSDQKTPDLSQIIQEIVDRPGWSSNNAIVLIISGSGKRDAYSYEGKRSKAPVLQIKYQE